MKKILSFFAAMLVAVAVNAAETTLEPGSDVLRQAVKNASAGDVLILTDGVYQEPEVVELNKSLTIQAAEGASPIVAQHYYMKLLNSAQVTFRGIKFDGGLYNDGAGANDHFIRPYDNSENKTLTLIACEICNWKNYVIYPQRADRCMKELTIRKCFFHDNARSAIYVETGSSSPLPLAELYIDNSTFAGTGSSYRAIDVKNGGSAVADAKIRIDHCTFYNYGPVRSEQSTDVVISNSIFAFPTEGATATNLYAGAAINNCLVFNMTHASGPTVTGEIAADPKFKDAANNDFTLDASSPAIAAGADDSNLGDARWWPAAPAHTYTVAGNLASVFGESWNPEYTANDMELQDDGKYKWEKTDLTLSAGSIEFKVCQDHAWTTCWPSQNYVLNISEDGIYTITITFEPGNDNKVSAEATKTGSADVDPTVAIKGGWDSWAQEVAFTLAADKKSASGVVNITAAADYEFKVILNGGDWRSNGYTYHRDFTGASGITGNADNMILTADIAGEYTFTWTFETNALEITFPEAEEELTGVIYDWAGEVGTTILGASSVEVSTVKIHKNEDAISGIKFSSSYVYADGKWIAIKPVKGGFKAGDEVKIAVCFNNASDDKKAQIRAFAADGNTELFITAQGINGQTSTDDPVVETFTLEADQDSIILGRQGNTGTFITLLKVERGGETPVVLEAPDAAPADPTLEAYQVKAVYSAKYSADCSFGEWGSGTQLTQEEFGKKYATTNLGYFGMEFTGMDCSEMEKLHLDAWVAADASIRVVPIHGGTEVGVTVELKGQQWNSIDIALSAFEGVTNWSNVYQIKIDNAANLTFWLNNVYFYTTQEKTVDLVDGYYLIGTMNSWDIHNLTAADKFAVNPENDKEYVLTTALAENDEFKVVAVANNALGAWYPGEGENYKVDFAHAGDSKDIYFRPDYQGGEGWHANCIYVAENVNTNPYETWFATGDTWNTETESYLEWNEDAKKATVHINVDKYGQWRAQVKYHGPIAEAGKYYRVALKMKANNALQNVTIKYQDNAEMIYVADAALEAGVEFVFDKKAAGVAGGNGIMVLDFGFAKAGDVIEIYDVVIEETEAPVSVLADGYYLIGTIGGVSGWTVADVKAENKFEQNPENNAEYMLNVTLAVGDELQVVNVVNDQISGDWFPGGEGNNYIVDAEHAGEVTIYFRPDRQGGDDWWKGCIYVDAKDEPVADCDWDNIGWLGDGSAEQTFGDQFKVCVGNPAPNVVNVQTPAWASGTGIYMTFPSAAFGEISLAEGAYKINGAGIILYVSAFTDKLTDVAIVCDGATYAFTVYNDKGKDASAIESNTIAPKAVKLIENGQLYIILNGVRYNALGQME